MKESHQQFAQVLTAACVRRGYLEHLHADITPVTKTGDYSDVRVIDADGRVIPWKEVSRINQCEMKWLMTGVVDRVFTFLARTLFSPAEHQEFTAAVDRAVVPWVKGWDKPEYLPYFLMQGKGKEE